MAGWLTEMLEARGTEKFALHEQYLNNQMVRVLKTIGFDRHYVRGEGPYLFDNEGHRYLDLLSGFGTFALGRNHPVVRDALREVVDAELPNLVQLDVSVLSGLLAEQLVATTPNQALSKVFFANSGAEAVEAAIKFSRYATGRDEILFCDKGYHGLTYGALSLTAGDMFATGFGPLLPGCHSVPFNDLGALEAALRSRRVAAFVVEPVQGKGVNIPEPDYLREVARLCKKYGTLFVADEIQCGLGRTGKMWAVEHWGAEPDLLLAAKALSGGHIPVGAVMCRPWIFDKVFDRMDRAVVHGSTFGKNNMAMAAGLATLRVLKEERLIENAALRGQQLLERMQPFVEKHQFVKDVRGLGLMFAIEFGSPKSLKLKAAWTLLERANKSLFCQMVLIPLLKKHRMLGQVAGHNMHVIKLLPPLVIGDDDVTWIVDAFDDVLTECHRVPGSLWDLGTTLAGHALSNRNRAA